MKFILFLLLAVSGTWFVLRASLLLKVRESKVLLSQVKAFRLRESTFQDAKSLADQYDGKVDYQGKPCTFESCTFTISLPRSWRELPSSVEEALRSIGRFIGIRAYVVESSISVRHGRIMETSFMVDTEAKLGTTTGQWLSAEVKASDRFPPPTSYYFGHQDGLDDHPNRKVIHPTLTTEGGGQVIWSEVTADANSTERTRAFDIHLSCLASLAGCSELRQLAPSAWEDLMALSRDEGKRRAEPRDYGECSSRSLAWLARDMNSVLLVEVRKVFPVKNVVDSLQDVDFGLIEELKGQAPKNLSRFPLDVPRGDAAAAGRDSSLPSRIFSPRNQLLLFLDDAVSLPYPRCEVVRASEENLAMVRQTVRQLAQGMPISALTDESATFLEFSQSKVSE